MDSLQYQTETLKMIIESLKVVNKKGLTQAEDSHNDEIKQDGVRDVATPIYEENK